MTSSSILVQLFSIERQKIVGKSEMDRKARGTNIDPLAEQFLIGLLDNILFKLVPRLNRDGFSITVRELRERVLGNYYKTQLRPARLMSEQLSTAYTTVSIIGTSGRKEDGPKMALPIYLSMIKTTMRVITETWRLDPRKIILVSGGAPWADHVAVHLFLEGFAPCLRLYLAAKWLKSEFGSSYEGKTLNKYHQEFCLKTGIDSFSQLEQARLKGAQVEIIPGFHNRNAPVAHSHYMLAFTWGAGNIPKPGGTADTWRQSNSIKLHVSLAKP